MNSEKQIFKFTEFVKDWGESPLKETLPIMKNVC
jgi:hypothetical protein